MADKSEVIIENVFLNPRSDASSVDYATKYAACRNDVVLVNLRRKWSVLRRNNEV